MKNLCVGKKVIDFVKSAYVANINPMTSLRSRSFSSSVAPEWYGDCSDMSNTEARSLDRPVILQDFYNGQETLDLYVSYKCLLSNDVTAMNKWLYFNEKSQLRIKFWSMSTFVMATQEYRIDGEFTYSSWFELFKSFREVSNGRIAEIWLDDEDESYLLFGNVNIL